MWVAPSGGGLDKGMWKKESFLPLCFLEFFFSCEFIYAVAASFAGEFFSLPP